MRAATRWAALGAAAGALHLAGRSTGPVPWRPSLLAASFAGGPLQPLGAIVREAALAAVAYLAVLAVLADVSRLPRLGWLGVALRRLPGGRAVLGVVAASSLAGTALLGPVAAADPASAGRVAAPVLSLVGPAGGGSSGSAPLSPVLRLVGPPAPPPPTTTIARPGTRPAPAAPPTSAAPTTSPTTSPTTWQGGAPPAGGQAPAPSSIGGLPGAGIPATVALPPTTTAAPVDPPRPTTTAGRSVGGQVEPSRSGTAEAPPATVGPPGASAMVPGRLAPGAAQAAPVPDAPAAGAAASLATVVLRPGDSLWSVAEATLTAALGHPPDEGRLGAYWWQVVTANRHRLPVPSDPDYVVPGWVALLPPVDGAAGA